MSDFTFNNNVAHKKNKSMANAIIRRMEKYATYDDSSCATYRGIAGKTAYFLLMSVVGVLLIGILHNIFADPALHIVDSEKGIYDFTTSGPELILVAIATVISIIVPFINFFVRSAVPVVGSIYCVAQGIFIGTITNFLAPQYKWASLLATVLTFAVVASMLFVYAKRIIRITQRAKGIVTSMFISIVVGGIVVFVLNLIPGVRNLMSGINEVLASPVFGVVLSVIFVVIAAFFLLADFDTIEKCVEGRMDKKYEWMAAWGLAYTIIYIYFKILRIILMVLGNSKGSSSSNKKSF